MEIAHNGCWITVILKSVLLSDGVLTFKKKINLCCHWQEVAFCCCGHISSTAVRSCVSSRSFHTGKRPDRQIQRDCSEKANPVFVPRFLSQGRTCCAAQRVCSPLQPKPACESEAILALGCFCTNQRQCLHIMSGVNSEMLVYFVPYLILLLGEYK